MNLERLQRMDDQDPLADLGDRFELPRGKTYLDGNSLGILPKGVAERIDRVVRQEWGEDLIASWNTHRWIDLPTRTGDRIGHLIGAAPCQVICADSISVNLFKLLSAALSMQKGRSTILTQKDNFPTDLYIAQGLSGLLGAKRCKIRSVSTEQLSGALGEDVAILMLTQVNFRDGRLHDIASLTAQAQESGALVLWDLAHSAGVIPLELDTWNVDMAVGCGYKYLNGGPGAPAFLYVARRHQAAARQSLQGWMGHAKPFAFSPDYEPAGDIQRFLTGTPGILGMAALDAALDAFEGVSIKGLRDKSVALTAAFIEALDGLDLPGVRLLTPREPELRGSQVSVAHDLGYEIAQALIAEGVIVDFRAPDTVRFGFSPLYNRFSDIATALGALSRIIHEERYLAPEFGQQKSVT